MPTRRLTIGPVLDKVDTYQNRNPAFPNEPPGSNRSDADSFIEATGDDLSPTSASSNERSPWSNGLCWPRTSKYGGWDGIINRL